MQWDSNGQGLGRLYYRDIVNENSDVASNITVLFIKAEFY